ncbi:iron hydrogenase [Fimicolochytrium jonesii]|uniref:iron hydrogenase n=1 Tax=Fimicolochytrium jonesii TaxID=1396493 RepID=UPI0022FDDA08|nr:iron hydrogenase [Fimicolochytrium jonesii]KAI8826171.1 iron hydrogenase [Fimicolochytrium jonesii]
MGFSGAVTLTDLNDFITPSQACIKPVEVKKKANDQSQIRIDDTGGYYEVSRDGDETKLETASISLNDCLACSGCITSAESVLITMQSHKELYDVLKANKEAEANGGVVSAGEVAMEVNGEEAPQRPQFRTVVISVSPQSRASLAAKYNITPLEVHKRLLWFFKSYLGAHYVFDTAFSRDFALLESGREFVKRYRQYRGGGAIGLQSPLSTSSPPSPPAPLPMLASACPGWICYAEKTHDHIIPYIDSTKSPQQIMGSLVKDYLARQVGHTSPAQVYHVAVMPCYDKKLEASRQDFYSDLYSTRDVDCVITTGEVDQMLAEHNMHLPDIPALPLDDSLFTKAVMHSPADNYNPMAITALIDAPILAGTEGSSSGGYLSYILRYAASELFNIQLSLEDVEAGTNGVEIRPGRNPDSKEYLFYLPTDTETPVLRFAIAYGFRNIQNLVRKVDAPASASAATGTGTGMRGAVRRRRVGAASASTAAVTAPYDYIEIMACPSGCINGGGQLKPPTPPPSPIPTTTPTNPRDWINLTEQAYRSVARTGGVQPPDRNAAVDLLYETWLGGRETEKAREMLHTRYRAVEKTDVSGLAVKW